MGFIIVAEGKQNLFIFSEVAWAVVSLGLSWWCIGQFGVVGAGIAFFASYIFHVFLTYAIVSRLTGFRWSLENLRAGSLSLGVVACVFCGGYVMPVWASVAFGACTTILAGVYSVRILFRIVPGDELPRPIRRLAHLLRLPQVA
jgi:PST family polysaccharide transporter